MSRITAKFLGVLVFTVASLALVEPAQVQNIVYNPQQMIAAYIEWRKQNPNGDWSIQPAVQANVVLNIAETFFRGLNYTPGVVNANLINLEVQGNSLVGSGNNLSVVLDGSDGTISLNGQKKDKLESSGGILIASQVGPKLSTEVVVIVLNVRPGIQHPH
jgi:hypothetical protein